MVVIIKDYIKEGSAKEREYKERIAYLILVYKD
jgi:hypothetical protein